MTEKPCFKCKKLKLLLFFYKHSEMSDGHINKCKECSKKDTKKNYKNNRKYYRIFNKIRYQENKEEINAKHKIYNKTLAGKRTNKKGCKKYSQTKKGKKVRSKNYKKYRQNNPLKEKAHSILHYAVTSKKIIKPKICSFCGKINYKIEAHHPSYNEGDELKVIWICKTCHDIIHKNLLIVCQKQKKIIPRK